MQKKCPICKGLIILSTKWRNSTFVSYEGNICDGQGGTSVLDKVYCEDCKVLFHPSVLGDFILTDKKPGWRKRKNETCGSCGSFRQEKGFSPNCSISGGIASKEWKACYKWHAN